MTNSKEVISLFECFMEEGEETDLNKAMALLDTSDIKLADLLQHVKDFKADAKFKAQTMAAIRKHYGLPLIPGAVCQRQY
jgi:hypothetical protein